MIVAYLDPSTVHDPVHRASRYSTYKEYLKCSAVELCLTDNIDQFLYAIFHAR